jgi:hypothetical protein
MENVNFKIEENDLKNLFVITRFCYGQISFNVFKEEIKENYLSYLKRPNSNKSFSEWVNAQIVCLT